MESDEIWNAIDKLAKINNMSPSAMAKKAGLNSTTFNKSKRIGPDGKKRWPSFESINKLIVAFNISLLDFYNIANPKNPNQNTLWPNLLPVCNYSNLKNEKIEQNTFVTSDWPKTAFPGRDENLYMLELDISNFEPFYNNGSNLIISKHTDIRKNDMVIIISKNGTVTIGKFFRQTMEYIELLPINAKASAKQSLSKIKMINRIVWASQ